MRVEIRRRSAECGNIEYNGGQQRFALPATAENGELELRFSVPIRNIQAYWTPELSAPVADLRWVIDNTCAGQRNFPFMVFMDTSGRNRFAFGLDDLADDVRITAKLNQMSGDYDVTVLVETTAATGPISFWADDRAIPWTHALAAWRESLALPAPRFPEAVWSPVFCTWDAVHAEVTQEWVEKNAAVAAELGFGTLIVDDGWCFDAMKRVTPQTIADWYENIGDWRMSTAKFPDFPAHRRRIRELGMNYMLWVTPFLIGVKSDFHRKFRDALYPEYREGCRVLDCGHADAARAMAEQMKRVLTEWELDGLKIDFLDSIPPSVAHPLGRSATDFIADLSSAIREAKPDAMIEFRQYYNTPGMLAHATQFRAHDAPFDFLDNLYCLAQIRISLGDRVPVHADPVYWHPDEPAVNVSRHLIASLAGVPMISMDMCRLGATERRIIRHWLDFYRDHLATFRDGHWEVEYFLGALVYLTVTDASGRIVFLLDPARLDEAVSGATGPVTILNLTLRELPLPGAETFGPEGVAGTPGVIPPGGRGTIG